MNRNLLNELDSVKEKLEKEKEKDYEEVFSKGLTLLQDKLDLSDTQMVIARNVLYHSMYKAFKQIDEDYTKYLK